MRSKDLHLAIKNGKDIDYLITKYGFANKEELFDVIYRIGHDKAEQFIRKLVRNQKRNHR